MGFRKIQPNFAKQLIKDFEAGTPTEPLASKKKKTVFYLKNWIGGHDEIRVYISCYHCAFSI